MPEVLEAITSLHTQTNDATPKGTFASFPNSPFELFQPYLPAGDQPQAIEKLVEGVNDGECALRRCVIRLGM